MSRGHRSPLLRPGSNCWRIERADRVAFLIDGEEYFGAVRAALANARRSIFILGWDIDSRMRLMPNGANDGLPEQLGDFLNAIVASRRELRGYILSWDFAMLYAMEREWLPIYKLDWSTHRRLSFRLDDKHPIGASQHQKLVVVDDSIAFVGGYDLTRARWDTSSHAVDDPARVDHRGEPYHPFHDVGMMVDGDCARALGELARQRWFRATGKVPRRMPSRPIPAPWPEAVEPAITSVDVAIARTEPPFDGRGGVREIRQLHLDAIESAQRGIFAENQYFTSKLITDAFAKRLEDADGPEICVISPFTQSGWLETSTMGVLRARNHRALRAADQHGRYRLYCPMLPWLHGRGGCLNVHSKVLTVDDDFLMIGSANLADRSMGTDTECNLAIEARGDARISSAIRHLRNRLLGEHMDCGPDVIDATMTRERSLHRMVAALTRPGERTLKAHDAEIDPQLDALVPTHEVLDPEKPLDPDEIVADLVPEHQARKGRARLIGVALAVTALAAMALAWRFTPLHEWFALDRLIDIGESLRDHPWAPLAVIAMFVIGALVVFPLTLLIAVTAVVFGPWLGMLYTLMGACVSGSMTFAIGRHLGRETVRRLAGRRLNDLSRRLGERGLIAVIVVRALPVAPFTIVNIVAGASHIRWRDFLLGSLIGLIPGVTTTSLFIDRVTAVIREPGAGSLALLGGAVLVIVSVLWAIRRKLRAVASSVAQRVPALHGS